MKREIIYRQPGNDENKIIEVKMAYWQLKDLYNNCIINRDNVLKYENAMSPKSEEMIEFLYQLHKANAPDSQKILFEEF